MVKFAIEFENSQALVDAFKKVSNQAEKLTNDYLNSTGSELVIKKIIGLMPVGERNNRHAKTSSSLKKEMMNLGFEIKPKKAFNYLVFPNDGIGKRNSNQQSFFELGLEQSESEILRGLIDKLYEAAKLT